MNARPRTRLALSFILGIAAVALMATPAGAAKGGKGGGGSDGGGGGKGGGSSSSVELVVLDADGVANHGDTITFDVVTDETDQPYVALTCTQSGTLVYEGVAGFFDDYPWSQDYVLDTPAWAGGAADCTAELFKSSRNGRTTTLATTTFVVAA